MINLSENDKQNLDCVKCDPRASSCMDCNTDQALKAGPDGSILIQFPLKSGLPASGVSGGSLVFHQNLLDASSFTPHSLKLRWGGALYLSSFRGTTAAGDPSSLKFQNNLGLSQWFGFEDGQSTARAEGREGVKEQKLIMVDAQGQPVTEAPFAYDLHTEDGYVFRYRADPSQAGFGELLSKRIPTGRLIDYGTAGFEFIRGSEGEFRQIMGPEVFVDIDVLSTNSYAIRVYNPEDVNPMKENGLYTLKTVTAENLPVKAIEEYTVSQPGASFDAFTLVSDVDEEVTTYRFSYTEGSDEWEMKVDGVTNGARQFKSYTAGGNGLYRQTDGWRWDLDQRVTEERFLEMTQLGEIPRRTRLVKDPGGLNLETLYEYYQNENAPHSLYRLKSIRNYDGSWMACAYDLSGRKSIELGPWMDTPAMPPANVEQGQNLGQATLYDYSPLLSGDVPLLNDSRPRTVTRKINGQIVGRTFYAYTVVNGQRVDIVERAASPNAAFGDPENLRSTTTYVASGPHQGRVESVQRPDMTQTRYSYALVAWDVANSAVLPNQPGDDFMVTMTEEGENGEVPYETTKRFIVQDRRGNSIYSETQVYTGPGSYETLSWEKRVYDAYGYLSETLNSKGERSTQDRQASCCAADLITDSQGITRKTEHDQLDRVKARIKLHPSDATKHLITEYILDAAGRVLMETTRDGADTLSLTSINEYDGLGRRTFSNPHTGGISSTEYQDANRIVIQNNPDGSTVITERYLDGRTKSVTGTAVTHQFYLYGYNADGSTWTQVFTGPALDQSPMWSKSTNNMLGQGIKTERPGYLGVILSSTRDYNDKGQLVESVPEVGASTRMEYDELGDQIRSYLDVNGDDQPNLAGPDRITESDDLYVKLGNDWWMESKSYVYDHGKNTPTLTGSSRQRLTGLGTVEAGKGTLVSESISIDIHGNISTSKRYLDRDNQIARSEQDSSLTTASPDARSLNINGLTTQSESREPESGDWLTTKFRFDELERQVGTKEPRMLEDPSDERIGWNSIEFKAGSNLIAKRIDPALNETLYAYYEGTDRLKSLTDPNLNTEFTAYTLDGLVAAKWGSTYPVVYEFDDYDRMLHLFTLRDPNHTFAPAVDPDTGVLSSDLPTLTAAMDQTTWVYEEATGLLLAKRYDDDPSFNLAIPRGPVYSYTPDGRLETRTWLRTTDGQPRAANNLLVTTYGYVPQTLELATTSYSDGTATVTNTYDRLGRLKSTDDDFGLKTYGYDDQFQLETETWAGLVNEVLTRKYKTDGRPEGLSLSGGYETTYAYYPVSGHLDSISYQRMVNGQPATPAYTAEYSYLDNSQMLNAVKIDDFQREVGYEPHRNLIKRVLNTHTDIDAIYVLSEFVYSNDAGGRRINRTDDGQAFESTQENIWGYNERNEGTSATMSNGSSSYSFDQIGNRVQVSVPEDPVPQVYVPNALNQYASISTGGTTATPVYDLDGNLTDSGDGKTLSWTGENRMESFSVGNITVENTYDGQGRRVRKLVKDLGVVTQDLRYMYDGWNLLYEMDEHAPLKPIQRYVWGLDLSQTMQGAGGVGGLLLTEVDAKLYAPTSDANGNISEYINLANGNITAHLEYDAFGRTIASTGAAPAPYGFSTKYLDQESGYYYYGYRYLDAETGRWLNRDPIEEDGSYNLYGFIENDGRNFWDYLGMSRGVGLSRMTTFSIMFSNIKQDKTSLYASSVIPIENIYSALEVYLDLVQYGRNTNSNAAMSYTRRPGKYGIIRYNLHEYTPDDDPSEVIHELLHVDHAIRLGWNFHFTSTGWKTEGIAYASDRVHEAMGTLKIIEDIIFNVDNTNDEKALALAYFWQRAWGAVGDGNFGNKIQNINLRGSVEKPIKEKDVSRLKTLYNFSMDCEAVARLYNQLLVTDGFDECFKFTCKVDPHKKYYNVKIDEEKNPESFPTEATLLWDVKWIK